MPRMEGAAARHRDYPAWQRVLNVGFRVVVRMPEKGDLLP